MNSSTPDSAAPDADYDTILRLMRERHTCRAFKPDVVAHETIIRLLEYAQRSASWHNVQPWKTIVTSGAATDRFRAGLFAAAQTTEVNSDIPQPEEYVDEYKARRRAAGYGLYESVGIERFDFEARERQSLENFRLFGAPHVLVVHSEAKLGPYGLVDCGAYISQLLLGAQALGLASAPQAAIAMQSSYVREHFGIPADRLIVGGVSFGYEASAPVNDFRTDRAGLDEVVTWLD